MAQEGQLDGNRLRQLRESRGITQEELADFVGVAKQQIWRWESGKNDPVGDMIVKLARVLNTSADYLLALDSDPSPRLKESDLSPMERKLVAAVRSGLIVEALESLTTLSKSIDLPSAASGEPVVNG